MISRPRKAFEKLASALTLILALPPQALASQEIYREFLSDSGIVSVSAEQIDEHHARIRSVQITHDQFREIRILNPDTGATELLEFSDPTLQVTYSLPSNGKFLKLEIERRGKEGFQRAELLLAQDGTHYIPVRNTFRKYQIFNHTPFDGSDIPACYPPQPSLVSDENLISALSRLRNTGSNVAINALDASCQKPPFQAEYKSMVQGLEQVVESRESSSPNNGNGKFLACLNQHHLTAVAERVKGYFNDSLKTPVTPSVKCEATSDGTDAQYFDPTKTTYFRKPCGYGTPQEQDAASYYADNFFHETLHRVGIEDESVVLNTVSCCGLEKGTNAPAACQKVEDEAAKLNERNARLIANREKLVGFQDFWLKVESNSDPQRADALYDDFFEMLKTNREKGKSGFSQCSQTDGKSQESCLQAFVEHADANFDQYFDESCPKRFPEKKHFAKNQFCEGLKADAEKMLKTNVFKTCDGTKADAFEKSCLFAAKERKDELMKTATATGDVLDEKPKLGADVEKLTASYLTAFDHMFPGTLSIYNHLKDTYEDDTVEAIFSALLKFMKGTASDIQSDYQKCIASDSALNCAKNVERDIFKDKHGMNTFFRRVCPTYFTLQENKDKPCQQMQNQITQLMKDSFAGGCKAGDPNQRIGGPGHDLTCLFGAIAEGDDNFAHYEQRKDRLNNTIANNSSDAAQYEKMSAAKAAGKAMKNVMSIPDQAKKSAAQASSSASASDSTSHHGWNRSPASASSQAIAFDPGTDFVKDLKEKVLQQGPSAGNVLRDAGRVISDLAVPSAQARNTQESDNLNAPAMNVPPSLNTDSGIAGDLETTRALNVAVINPLSFASQGARSGSQASGSAHPQGPGPSDHPVSGKTAADDRARAQASGRTPASSSASAATSGRTALAETANHDGNVTRRGNSSNESLHASQSRLLLLFKKSPGSALKQLKSGVLSAELLSDRIEAIDDEARVHGAKNPLIRIWYDSSTATFKGLPEP